MLRMKKLLAVPLLLFAFAVLGLAKDPCPNNEPGCLRLFIESHSTFTGQLEPLPLAVVTHRPILTAGNYPDPNCPWCFVPTCQPGGGVTTDWMCILEFERYWACMDNAGSCAAGPPPGLSAVLPRRDSSTPEVYWRKGPDILARLW
jgi:hypothetical protein